MRRALKALFVSLAVIAALSVLGDARRRRRRQAQARFKVQTLEAQAERTAARSALSSAAELCLTSLLTLLALGLLALMVMGPSDGLELGGGDAAAAAREVNATPTPTASPPPLVAAGEQIAAALVSDPEVGGDQPTGPLAAVPGDIPENQGLASEMLALRDRLQQEILDYQALVGDIDVAIAVTDLQTGETVSIGGNAPHKTGCTINMFALFAAVSEFQAGNASPDDVAYSIWRGIGGSYPPEVKRFLDAVFPSYQDGVARARELMTAWGMKVSYFDHIPYFGGTDPAPNVLTALETNDILARLYRGQLFNPEWTQYTLGVLRDIAYYVQYILPKWLPEGATVAHKIGYYWDYDGWVNNDAGIVTFTGGDGQEKAYVITYLSQRARTEQIGYSFGARLSKIVWDFMAPRYGVANESWVPDIYIAPPSYNPAPEPEPEPEETPVPEPPPSPIPTPSPAPTPAPPTGVPTPTPTPAPTATPAPPSATPVPPTPTPGPTGGP